ncbi:uncharacterized protein LOC141696079 [Apium graveolens]|uniref:uncharacterized protein LOC141696079 n=1 Tax=Apium graveolens TaxID=4045 RepID=UPI003D78C312
MKSGRRFKCALRVVVFSCNKCNKKYAVLCDLKAHDKICGTKKYKCECGINFFRLDNFISHRSSCAAVAEEVARHTIKSSPNSQAAASILSNASNPASISLGLSTGSFISPDGNLQQLPSLPALGASPPISFTGLLSGHTVGSQPMHPPNMTLYPFGEPKLWFTRVSGVEGFRSKTGPTNIVNLGFNGPANLMNTHNSFTTDFLLNAQASLYNVLNRTPYNPPTLTGTNSNNGAFMNSIGRSLPSGVKLNSFVGSQPMHPPNMTLYQINLLEYFCFYFPCFEY